jgi:type VI protein secretion system component Hcp
MSQSTKSQPEKASDAPTKTSGELDRDALEKVSGGKVTTSDITITKQYDKSSPVLGH